MIQVGNHTQQASAATTTTSTNRSSVRTDRTQQRQQQHQEQFIPMNGINNNNEAALNNMNNHQNTKNTAGETQTIRVNDVLCGRGKVDHGGNAYFRQVVAEQLNDFKLYQSQKNRHGMSMVVHRIIQKVHATGGRFMDQNWRGMWVELSEKERRQKVDRACRDAKKNSVSSNTRTTVTSTAAASRTNASSAIAASNLVGRAPDPTKTGIQYHTSSNTQQQFLNHLNYNVDQFVSSAPSVPSSTAVDTVVVTNTGSITINQNSNAGDSILPPSTMARLYPLSSGIHNNGSTNKRNSNGQIIQEPTTAPRNSESQAHIQHKSTSIPASQAKLSSLMVADVPSSSLSVHNSNNLGSNGADKRVGLMISDFLQVGSRTYNDEPNAKTNGDDNNMMENSLSSLESFDKVTRTAATTLSSSYITTPSLEFSCGSLALENSFVLPDRPQNNVNNNESEPAIPSLIRQHQQTSQHKNAMDAPPKKTPGQNNPQNSLTANTSWTMASISSIPNDFLNRSVISEMDFSAVSLDLFTPCEEEITERSTDTEENEPTESLKSTSTTSTTATSTQRDGTGCTPHGPLNQSTVMLDASVGVLDLNQSYGMGSFFDASFDNESAVMTTSLTNTSERQQAFRLSVGSTTKAPQQERYLDRYDLLKREESVDTIIAGNLKRHSQISTTGLPKAKDSTDDELHESFNMSLDICALPSTHEEEEEDETPKSERVVKNVFAEQKSQPLPDGQQQQQQQHQYVSPHQKSPERKKIKDATQSSLSSQLTSNNSLWLSSDEFTTKCGNDSESVTSSLFSA